MLGLLIWSNVVFSSILIIGYMLGFILVIDGIAILKDARGQKKFLAQKEAQE